MSARHERRRGARAVEATRREAPRAVYDDVRGRIRTGDVLLFRGRTLFSRAIRLMTGSIYSHVAIAAWWADHLVVFESRRQGGVRVRPLRRALRGYDGQVDWWALRPDVAARLDPKALLHRAVGEVGKPYAIRGVLALAWRLVAGRLAGSGDAVSLPQALFCSQYVSLCFREANVDLAPDVEDACTSPGAIARSGLLELKAVLRRAPG